MSKIRVYELAKELEISSKELIALLKDEFGIEVKNHMSVVEEEDAALIKELLGDSEGNKDAVKEDSMDTEGKVTKSIVDEYEEILEEEVVNLAKKKKKTRRELAQEQLEAEEAALANMKVEIGEFITVKEFADKLGKPVAEVIKALIFTGIMAGINQEIDFETAEKAAKRLEIDIVKSKDDASGISDEKEEDLLDVNLEKRPPIVTVMGHVDHGKTSLLDAIRKAKVTESEAGGITQHIGAYTITINGEKITFLDTPGHEAFTAMRARGAQVTDIVILVVAADDGIMPQTAEAINHCKAANVPMIVAINKIDVEGANIDKVKQELTEYGLVAEEWGGDTICVPVSAKQRMGIDDLLEMVLLTAEVEELKADSNRRAAGTVIESELDKGRGPVATLLVQKGTLNVGDSILVGSTYGRIRAMFDDKGKKIKSAGPSIPVEILGLSEVPQAGDKFHEVKDEKTARGMAEARKIKEKSLQQSTMRVSLEDLYSQVKEGKIKELPIIIKADVQGSIEALKGTLEKLSTDEIKVRVIHGGVGAVTETDISLAAASNAVVIGFNVRPDNNAQVLAEKEKVYVKTYRVIYHAVDDIKAAMIGMLAPEIKEVVQGRVEIRQTYKVSAIGTIAGCYVLNGKITRNSEIRLLRDGVIIHEGKLASLKRFKDDAKEVLAGFECGLSIEKFNEIKEGDIIEAYVMESIVRKEL
ncbi:translation initiation factor IF-2 [Proteiniclasticum ruminis]|uniref:Translation initiation factor IF-2 n=1 Tax=Proteiniclasticum ruminis TaxID=398199 RepID=A0A1I4YEA3_9CLOT|nr:translation initiation factor IF-2 [Proteiniclasticum ruminis]SFN35930.1 bacterial translation initiation factor 2 (bIF-2) [Proteiniclasticum ruminis]